MASTGARTFPKLLRQYRMAAGLTQEELAERAGLSVRAIGDLERGVRHFPQQHTVRQLADSLALSTEERAAFFAAVRAGASLPGGDRPASTVAPPPADAPIGVDNGQPPAEADVSTLDALGTLPERRAVPPRAIRPTRRLLAALGFSLALLGLLVIAFVQWFPRQKAAPAALAIAADTFKPWGAVAGPPTRFALPYGIAIDGNGNIYVVDTSHNQVDELSSDGKPLEQWEGSGNGRLSGPSGVAVDAAGDVYVADTGNSRIQKLAPDGALTPVWQGDGIWHGQSGLAYPLINPLGVTVDRQGNVYAANTGGNNITGISRSGRDLGGISGGVVTLNAPSGIAVDSRGNIYVTDTGNNRIQIFSSTYTPIATWGSAGSGPGQLLDPTGIAIDGTSNIYVADTGNNRIQKFSPTGKPLATLGRSGTGPGQFREPIGVALDRAGNIYVADSGNARIQKLSPAGTPLARWTVTRTVRAVRLDTPSALTVDSRDDVDVVTGSSTNRIERLSSSGRYLATWPVEAGAPAAIAAVAADEQGNVYIVDELNDQIRKFTAAGKLLASWGSAGTEPGQFEAPSGIVVARNGDIYVADSGNRRVQKLSPSGAPVAQFGAYGFGPGRFLSPRGLALDARGDIYVTDSQRDRIQEFSPMGAYLAGWGTKGSGPGEFDGPIAVAIDRNGALFVVDEGNDRVQKFSHHGAFLASWGGRGWLSGQFDDPVSVALDREGRVYVADRGNNRIQRLQPNR